MSSALLSGGLNSLLKVLISHKEKFKGVLIALLTIGIDQIVEIAAFRCPCIPENTPLNQSCDVFVHFEDYCPLRAKALYAYSFIFAPFILLLLIGLSFNRAVWRSVTGCWKDCNCCEREPCSCGNSFNNFIQSFGFAMIAPAVWLALSFFDGDYFACALANYPYQFNGDQTCEDFKELDLSKEYFASKRISQIVGWSLAVSIFLLALITYFVYRCFLPMTYTQSRLNKKWRLAMEESLTEAYLQTMKSSNEEVEVNKMSEDPKEVFNRLKHENDELKRNFWKNLEKNLSSESDATNFKLQSCFQEDIS